MQKSKTPDGKLIDDMYGLHVVVDDSLPENYIQLVTKPSNPYVVPHYGIKKEGPNHQITPHTPFYPMVPKDQWDPNPWIDPSKVTPFTPHPIFPHVPFPIPEKDRTAEILQKLMEDQRKKSKETEMMKKIEDLEAKLDAALERIKVLELKTGVVLPAVCTIARGLFQAGGIKVLDHAGVALTEQEITDAAARHFGLSPEDWNARSDDERISMTVKYIVFTNNPNGEVE